MSLRERFRPRSSPQGTYYRNFFGYETWNGGSNFVSDRDYIMDVHDEPRTPHILDIKKVGFKEGRLMRMDGYDSNGYVTYEFSGYVPEYLQATALAGYHRDRSLSPDPITTLIARTNPSRPVVSVASFIGELREFPQIMRFHGRNLIHGTAEGTLAAQYGWVPLMQDLKTMADFGRHINRRINELQRLRSRSGLRRRLQLSSGANVSNNDLVIIQSDGALVVARRRVSTKWKQWGTIRWMPDENFRFPAGYDEDLMARTESIVNGLQAYVPTQGDVGSIAADAWELLPWSWLVDWFGTVGEFIQANRNTVGATARDGCVMTHSKTTTTYKVISKPSWIEMNDTATHIYETKERQVGDYPSIAAGLPFMNGTRLSVLGALGILKGDTLTRFRRTRWT